MDLLTDCYQISTIDFNKPRNDRTEIETNVKSCT